MNGSVLDFVYAIQPAVYVAAGFPVLLALLIWIVFYTRCDAKKLHTLTVVLNKMTAASYAIEDCSMANLEILENNLDINNKTDFSSAWKRMKKQISSQYIEDLIPEAKTFFNTEALIDIPGGRKSVGGLWGSMAILALLAFLFPLCASIFIAGTLMLEAMLLGVLSAILIFIIHLCFVVTDQRVYGKALNALNRFNDAFDTVLPVAGVLAGSALMIQATHENRKTFEASIAKMMVNTDEATKKITDKFDEFTKDGVLPALSSAVQAITDQHLVPAVNTLKTLTSETISKIADLQEAGMAEMASSFAMRLADTLEPRLNDLATNIGQITEGMAVIGAQSDERMKGFEKQYIGLMAEVDKRLGEHMTKSSEQSTQLLAGINTELAGLMHTMSTQISGNITALAEMLENQNKAFGRSSDILIKAAELQGQAEVNSENLNGNVGLMVETMTKFQTQTDSFIKELMEFSGQNSEAQQKMAVNIQESQLKLEETLGSSMEKHAQMSELISGMMNDITVHMNEAMAGAGQEIAKGINQVTAENAEAISKLTVQAENLRNDYTSYFDRMEGSTKNMMEDLDYQMHGLMATLTEGLGAMLKETVQENASVLSQYQDQTVTLLQSFEAQATNISLYAKDISMDITDLTLGIRATVVEFTDSIQQGVRVTISEFDQGLAELTDRISNTVESISEAVESIPSALNRK